MKLFLTIFLFIGSFCLKAQPILDSQFNWHKNKNCITHLTENDWYIKVEEDPELIEFTKNDFWSLLSNLSDNLKINTDYSGHLKLKIYFPLEGNICLGEIGENQNALSQKQLDIWYRNLAGLSNFNCGKQRGRMQNCIGLIFIKIEKGIITEFLNFNFGFSG